MPGFFYACGAAGPAHARTKIRYARAYCVCQAMRVPRCMVHPASLHRLPACPV